jgi:hypothetical protein
MPRKQRILVSQRQALRAWVLQQHTRPSQKACIAWFKSQYNQDISQSTVSESLSSHFNSIDTSTNTTRSRLRTGQWPDLENSLILWQQELEEKGDTPDGKLLRAKAQQLWHQLPQYSGIPCPEFSNGWLQKFKKRHDTGHLPHSTVQRDSASFSKTTRGRMNGTRSSAAAGELGKHNLYDVDEKGPYWIMPRFCSWVLEGGVRRNLTFTDDTQLNQS